VSISPDASQHFGSRRRDSCTAVDIVNACEVYKFGSSRTAKNTDQCALALKQQQLDTSLVEGEYTDLYVLSSTCV
jgi:hypothetical protein